MSVLDRARIDRDDVVLEVGPGAGLLASGALDRVGVDGSVIALDVSVDSLDDLRARCPDPRLSLLVGDAEVVPLPDISVDVVVGCFVLSTVLERSEAVRELYRVLRPEGRISLFEPAVDAEGAEALLAATGFVVLDTEHVPELLLAGEKP